MRKKGKERDRIFILFWKNLVNLLKLPVATVYVDCTDYASCKRLCVEYTTFARKATYCIRIVRLVRVSDLLRTYTTCALEATLCVQCTSVRVSDLMRTYSTAFARKLLMRSKRLVRTMYDFCAYSDLVRT